MPKMGKRSRHTVVPSNSRQSPFATTKMMQQAGVAQDLQLLTNFIPHMAVVGMEFFQLAGEGISV